MMTNSTNALLRNQGGNAYQNPTSLGIKQSNANQPQKYLSKSPNQQAKMMANTNYGKFKMIPS